jgi:uroporphyrinogen-III synthase
MVQKDHSLKGRTIVVTRPREQAEETIKAIETHGGKPYLFPTIEIQAPRDPSKAKAFFEALAQKKVDYVVLMSVNGVQYLLNAAESLGITDEVKRNLKSVVMMAVGPKTAQELEKNGIHVDVVPQKYTSEGILQYFQQYNVKSKTIYVPRTSESPPELGVKLREMGNHVEEVYVYQSQLPKDTVSAANFVKDLANGEVGAILFTSSLGVRNFFEMLTCVISGSKLKTLIQEKAVVVAIGPTTAKTLTDAGVKVDVMPENHTLDETLNALVRYWNADGS